MSGTRLVALIDLGFGDSGKGLYTDYLTRTLGAHTVVRFNGGGQAGHNVCLRDGRHHTFSQFGAGSFVPGVCTLLASPVVVHPTALLVERDWLARAGVPDALERLRIDARCRVTTPFHQAAGRLRELLRGAGAHGTCGVGVGETVGHALQHPASQLLFADLASPARCADKLDAIRQQLLAKIDLDAANRCPDSRAQDELAILLDGRIAARWLAQLAALNRLPLAASRDEVASLIVAPGSTVFEGAQGMLLDEDHGFHPHTTWSRVGPAAAEAVAREAGVDAPLLHLGVLRSYLTRHGAGPLPTADAALDAGAVLAEPHNGGAGWQGAFRRGHPDAVLLRYAVACAGRIDGIVSTHHDAFDRLSTGLRWCDAYLADGRTVSDLPVGAVPDLDRQSRLTALLQSAQPLYAAGRVNNSDDWCAAVESATGAPVWLCSHGPTAGDVRVRGEWSTAIG